MTHRLSHAILAGGLVLVGALIDMPAADACWENCRAKCTSRRSRTTGRCCRHHKFWLINTGCAQRCSENYLHTDNGCVSACEGRVRSCQQREEAARRSAEERRRLEADRARRTEQARSAASTAQIAANNARRSLAAARAAALRGDKGSVDAAAREAEQHAAQARSTAGSVNNICR
jgi:hypothetical protein